MKICFSTMIIICPPQNVFLSLLNFLVNGLRKETYYYIYPRPTRISPEVRNRCNVAYSMMSILHCALVHLTRFTCSSPVSTPTTEQLSSGK